MLKYTICALKNCVYTNNRSYDSDSSETAYVSTVRNTNWGISYTCIMVYYTRHTVKVQVRVQYNKLIFMHRFFILHRIKLNIRN